MSSGDVTKYDALLEKPVETIYMTLIYEKEKRDFEKRLTEIYNRQNELSRHS